MASNIALLTVHGIGTQKPGETLDKLLSGIRRFDQNSIPKDIHNGVLGTVGGQPIRFYEVYWADLLKGDITRGAFQMNELQSLSWFPWFNLRRGNYRRGSYSFLKLAWWCVALPIVSFLMLLGYYGAGALAQIFGGTIGKRKGVKTDSTSSQIARKIFGYGTTLTNVDRFLDEYIGDVFSYVNSAGEAFYREAKEPEVPPKVKHVYTDIVQRFYDELVRAADGSTTIQIVAHSLGSVVIYHALSRFRFDAGQRHDGDAIEAAIAKVSHIYTIGCPLEKIRFFWSRLIPRGAPVARSGVYWDNFVSWFDPVAGMLRSLEDWGNVTNHRLLGGGFFTGHVVYEHSQTFMIALMQGLCGHYIPFKRGLAERLWDWLVLIGETLLAPTVLSVLLTVGAALFAIVALVLPWGLSWIARWFLPPETWAPIVDAASLAILGVMTLIFLAVPAMRARKVHSLYWVVAPHKRILRQEP